MPRRRAASSSTNVPSACVRTNASGSAIERSTCVSAAKLTTASAPSIALGDRRGILDRAVHEAEVGSDVFEVLAAPRVGQLVEHDDLVAVLARAQAREVRADEAGAAADEQLHVSPRSPRAARGRRRARPASRQPRRVGALGVQHAEGGARRGARELVGRGGVDGAVESGLASISVAKLEPRALAGARDVQDAVACASQRARPARVRGGPSTSGSRPDRPRRAALTLGAERSIVSTKLRRPTPNSHAVRTTRGRAGPATTPLAVELGAPVAPSAARRVGLDVGLGASPEKT